MSANIRAILIAIAGFAAVLLAIWGVDHGIVQPAFVELEQAQVLEDGARARAVIQSELRQLDQKLGDWAEWGDAYVFAASRDPAFIESNLGDWGVLEKSTQLNLCVILDRQGRALYGGGYDSDLGGAVLPAAFAGESPAIWATLQPGLEQEQGRAGLLLTEHGLLLLAARPILTTQGAGPARGLLAFGRFLDEPLRRALAEQTQVAFELLPAGDPGLTPAERAYLTTRRAGKPELRPGPAGAGFVYEVLPDLAGQPVALLRTPIRQAISATARHTSHTLVGALGLAALALLLGQAVWSNRVRRDGTGATGLRPGPGLFVRPAPAGGGLRRHLVRPFHCLRRPETTTMAWHRVVQWSLVGVLLARSCSAPIQPRPPTRGGQRACRLLSVFTKPALLLKLEGDLP
jgi:sensor domain CHASE-containing protein